MALYFESVIRVMAFQNFAQKHSKSDMLLLILYCLIESFGSACSAVLCKLYLCVWVIFSGGGFVVLPEVNVFHLLKKKLFSVLFNVPKSSLLIVWASFLPPLLGGFNFFFFVHLFVFCNAASPEACRELSDLYGSCFVGNLSLGSQRVGGSGG